MRPSLLALAGAVLLLVPVWGQAQGPGDNAIIDGILGQEAISWGNAAWLVGRATGAFDEATTPAAAAELAAKAGWGPSGLSAEAPIDAKAYSLILVKALAIPTGLMYGLFPGPRYAFRELIFRRIVPGTLAPDGAVRGEDAMRYLQAAQDWKEAHT
ncbi:MAG TPA: hypothetical protein VFL04_01995 [Rectinemataceae bacterium]|nr:hypothetical protein [Rectinemataceae bacterium]